MTFPSDRVMGTAGHIDHGKTALVRALTGVDTDRLPAEKLRGITIDLGFASLTLGKHQLALIDVPGHERFIRNMLAGATGLDLALLVVAADDSVMPQTREHLEILRLLGLSGGVIALTKCDAADPDWLHLVEDDVRRLVAGTFLENAEIVRTSATTGAGIDDLKQALERLCDQFPTRIDLGPFRMAIDRSFTRAGHGTIVTGTVASGRVQVGDELQWWPEGRSVRVRGLHRHDRSVEVIGRGSRAAINLGGVHHTEVHRGQELASPGYLRASRMISVEVSASADAPRPMKHRARYRVHMGTTEVSASLGLLGPNSLGAGETALAQLFLLHPVVSVHGQPFVIREESPPATLGGGKILQTSSQRLRRKDLASIDRLRRLNSPDPADRILAAMAFAGLTAPTDLDFCRECGVPLAEVPHQLQSLAETGNLEELATNSRRPIRVVSELARALESRVLRALERLHAARPRQTAIDPSHLLAELPDLGGDSLVNSLLDRLKADGKVVGDHRAISLKGFKPKLSHSERKLKAELGLAIESGGISPPDLAELSTHFGAKPAVVRELLALLGDEGRVVDIGHGLFLDSEVDFRIRKLVRDRLLGENSLTMSELRDLLGTSRKFAVPIGEYLDRIGWTRRDGDRRFAGPQLATDREEGISGGRCPE